ncbi:uncharacterized protein L201_003537 [Kwoniella dendrophila CBS 6074]|uniref:SMODS and SLOG-associating 2TM effector domain-containing protein n=1 Tax=Kwoniella dendrophila CBS 6074 TaxID=1295534 RepID=A0AAX4JUQ4_9TREE
MPTIQEGFDRSSILAVTAAQAEYGPETPVVSSQPMSRSETGNTPTMPVNQANKSTSKSRIPDKDICQIVLIFIANLILGAAVIIIYVLENINTLDWERLAYVVSWISILVSCTTAAIYMILDSNKDSGEILENIQHINHLLSNFSSDFSHTVMRHKREMDINMYLERIQAHDNAARQLFEELANFVAS